MEYIFGYVQHNGVTVENLKTVGNSHSELSGFIQTVREYQDTTITDVFRITERYRSDEDGEGNCYDWYVIDKHYRYVDETKPLKAENTMLKAQVNAQSAVASITFVTLCEVGTLDMVTASEHVEMFAEWAYPVAYTAGKLRRYNGTLYKCVQAHTSQADWTPDTAASLWSVAADPAEEWPAWSQPVGAHDAYAKGDKVSHNGKHWTSDVDNNVWEPGVYGWTEATE